MYSLLNAIKEAKDYLGNGYFEGLNINYKQVNEKSLLKLSKNKSDINIEYGDLSSLFYALSLIKQNHNKEQYEISLNRHFDTNGLMHDCSRNGPLNIKQAKEMIKILALFGLNRFMLYTEETYEIKGEPFFGYQRGRYTKEELKDLDEYAKSFGVELVPCIQTLSHLLQILKWPVYSNIVDTWNTLLCDEPKTYELIGKMLDTCRDCFSTRNIHIGMDEAFDIGSGTFIWKNISIDKKETFLRHLNKVVDMCKERGLHPIMWADMFFKLDMRQEGFYPDWYIFKGKLSDSIKSLIPDVNLVYWDYYHGDVKQYDRLLEACLDTKKDVTFAGGAISWIGYAPNITHSIKYSEAGLKSSIKHHVRNVFITSWGDNGNECSVVASYPVMALHSMYEFYGKSNKEELSQILETVTGDSLNRWTLLQEINHIRKAFVAYENPSKPFLYQDLLLGLVDKSVKIEYEEVLKKCARKYAIAAKKSAKFGYVYQSLGALSSLLAVKVALGVKLRNAYQKQDKYALKLLLNEIKLCKSRLTKFISIYREQWNRENKIFGFEVIDGRLGFLAHRIDTAYIRVNQYLNGEIDSIPELEVEILPWRDLKEDDPVFIGSWTEIITANAI